MVKKVLHSITGKTPYSRKIFIFLIFLAIATIVWFVNELSLEYVSDFRCQINTQNSANKDAQRLTTLEPVDMKVKTRGFLLVYNRLSLPEIEIDTKNYRVNKHPDHPNIHYIIINGALRNDITSKLDQDVKVESFASDTLFLKPLKK